MFFIGDVLIKIDTRAWTSASFDTRHHAMLVVNITEEGYPVVAHMKFTDFKYRTGSLIIENCPTAKDLFLIHCPGFTQALREQIVRFALQAHLNNRLL